MIYSARIERHATDRWKDKENGVLTEIKEATAHMLFAISKKKGKLSVIVNHSGRQLCSKQESRRTELANHQ